MSAPLNPLQPVLSITAAETLGPCDSLKIDFSSCTGKAGRPWQHSTLSILGYSSVVDVSAVQALLDKSKSDDTLLLDYNLFSSAGKYNLLMTRCNFLSACASVSQVIWVLEKNDYIQPSVNIYGSKQRQVTRNEKVELQADAYLAICGTSNATDDNSGNTKSISSLSFTWSVKSDDVVIYELVSIAKDPSVFRLDPYVLTPGNVYVITVAAFVTNSMNTGSTASVMLSVVRGNVRALIINGEYLTTREYSTVELDATPSFDEDAPQLSVSSNDDNSNSNDDNSNGNPNLFYQWNCRRVLNNALGSIGGSDSVDESTSCTANNNLGLPLNFESMTHPRLTVEAKMEGMYVFDLVVFDVTDPDRFDTTSLTLEVKSGEYPAVNFPSSNVLDMNNADRLNIAAYAYISRKASYYWSSKPNTKRGDHYHKKTTQWMYITKGSLEYWYKPLKSNLREVNFGFFTFPANKTFLQL